MAIQLAYQQHQYVIPANGVASNGNNAACQYRNGGGVMCLQLNMKVMMAYSVSNDSVMYNIVFSTIIEGGYYNDAQSMWLMAIIVSMKSMIQCIYPLFNLYNDSILWPVLCVFILFNET